MRTNSAGNPFWGRHCFWCDGVVLRLAMAEARRPGRSWNEVVKWHQFCAWLDSLDPLSWCSVTDSSATLEMWTTHSSGHFFHQLEWGAQDSEHKLEDKALECLQCLGEQLGFLPTQVFWWLKNHVWIEMQCFKGAQRPRKIGMLQRIFPGNAFYFFVGMALGEPAVSLARCSR